MAILDVLAPNAIEVHDATKLYLGSLCLTKHETFRSAFKRICREMIALREGLVPRDPLKAARVQPLAGDEIGNDGRYPGSNVVSLRSSMKFKSRA